MYIAVLVGRYWCLIQQRYVTIQPRIDSPDDRAAKILFVVRAKPGMTARILYKIPVNTYHAYNYEGGGSLYDDCRLNPDGQPRVTLLRPGGGTGGIIGPSDYANPDIYDARSPRQTFAHWDALCIAWLESHSYRADYCTDCDIDGDTDGHLLGLYDLLLSAGHDEYWSDGMRDNVGRFIESGGNVAFLGGNTCWWRVEYDDLSRTAITCHKNRHVPVAGTLRWGQIGNWWVYGRPENSLTGVSYRRGGGLWHGSRPALGYTVQNADHWVFAGTRLKNGDTFGSSERLVGYECDGAEVTFMPEAGMVVTGKDQTPLNFVVLGHAGPLDSQWQDLPPNETSGSEHDNYFATMGMFQRKGRVFTAATTDWVRVMMTNSLVETITCNVLDELSRRDCPSL